MQINIKTSEENRQIVQDLTRKFNLGTENIIARIALAYSLTQNTVLKPDNIKDSKGKEYKDDVLFGNYKDFYIALVCQKYKLFRTDKDIGKYIKLHIDDGLEIINKILKNNSNYTGFDFLLDSIDKGIESIDNSDISTQHVKNYNQKTLKDAYTDLIRVLIGKEIDSEQPIYLNINDENLYNNCHIAVAGNSGTGKTQFALELLSQITQITKSKVNFIYLDFKGLKDDDIQQYSSFFNTTKSIFIDAPYTPFPINPLSFIDPINNKNKILGINKFVDIIEKYAYIGKNQVQTLKDATKEIFSEKTNGDIPTIPEIYERIIEKEGPKASKLREIMESLSELELFENDISKQSDFFNNNYYLSLSGDIPNSVRFTATFLIINYIYNTFMNMENSPVENDHRGIRYVFLIDEAHIIFKEKRSQDLLEKILREIRSKGVSVVLLSQGIEEFNQPSFDFSSMCEMAFLLDVKDKNNIRSISRFLGVSGEDSEKALRNLEKIQKGQAISNIKEYRKCDVFLLNQFFFNK